MTINMNHQHLRYFWTVAKEGSVSKACRQLNLAQSTVSGQIIQLENALGKKLFDRRKKRLFLTDEGRVVLSYAETIFNQTQEMVDHVMHGTYRQPPLRLACDVTVSAQVMIEVMKAVRGWEPTTQVQVQQATLPQLMDRLRRFACHLIVTDQPGDTGDAAEVFRREVERLGIDFVCTPTLARRVKRFPDDLAHVPMLLPVPSHPLWSVLQEFLREHHIQPPQEIEIQDPDLQREMALAGLGVAPLHELIVRRDLQRKRLVRLGAAPASVTKTLWFVAKKGPSVHPLVSKLMSHFNFSK